MAMQSPSFLYGFTYQVFLSFKGSDTRYGFTGNLYKALLDRGIHAFMDDTDLQRGDQIRPSLANAIQQSRILIPVFSANYASSSFCLDELVQIIHCFKEKGRHVLPVFYCVEPSHVRHQRGSYGEALAKYEERFQNNMKDTEQLHQWKMALNQAANLSGYHFNLGNEYEHKFIEKIVKEVSNKIDRTPLNVVDYPVGLESRVLQVNSLLDVGNGNVVYMIGIHGTGGIGKTTLARAVYNLVIDQFECSCFLHNVRELSSKHGLEHLQKQLISKTTGLKIQLQNVNEGVPIIKQRLHQKKVLVILDDVDELKQLQFLVGGLDWFGLGSRVIVTTRDKHLLQCHEVERIYEVDGLNEEEALELFRWMAFKNNKIDSSYDDILHRAISYASGFPLAIEIVGSNLFEKGIKEWESTLDKYERIPHEDIQRILKVSFDSLDEEEKSVFLDIACCFKGCRLTKVEEILHAHYGHSIKHHVGVLVDKSLIKITWGHMSGTNDVKLHDLIEDMGKEIVRQESLKEPGERTRLWFHKDIAHVLNENTGTGKIEMIYMNSPSMEDVIDWNGKAFKKMKNLKTLIIKSGHFSKSCQYFPKSLRVLEWQNYPSESILSSFLNKKFQNMHVLKFDKCEYLTHIPNVSCLPNLQNFSFKYCENLITIDNSIGFLRKLEILTAKGCVKLRSFPPLELTCLKKLDICDCKSLESFPEILGKMENIKHICIYGTSIECFPVSFQNLIELISVFITGRGIFRLSSIICKMPKLSRIWIQGCRLLLPSLNGKLSSTVSSNVEFLDLVTNTLSYECLLVVLTLCSNVRYLDLSKNNFKILPECLKQCRFLHSLKLDDCKSLEEIRGIPPNLKWLCALRCESLNSSSRSMLLNKELHEYGWTNLWFPSKNEMIPEWFEHQSTVPTTISFWFRNKIPSLGLFISTKSMHNNKDPNNRDLSLRFKMFLNGREYIYRLDYWNCWMQTDHIYLSDMDLKRRVQCRKNNVTLESELGEALFKSEWIYAELKFEIEWKSCSKLQCDEDEVTKYCITEMGIHVFNEKNNMDDIRFIDPCRKRKFEEHLNTSQSLFLPLLKKKRLMTDMEVFETELAEQQHRMAFLSL